MPNPNEATSETIPPVSFNALEFWRDHQSKVLLYGGIFFVALLAYGAYEMIEERNQAEARAAFASAKSPEDFRKIAQQFPKSVVAGNAQLMLAGQLREEKKYDEAIATLRGFIAASPQHPLIAAAWLSLAETLAVAGKNDEALDAFQQIPTKFPDSYAAPLSFLERAKILKAKGKNDEAKRAYESVVSQYPESIFAREAMQEMQLLRKK